MSEYGDFCRAQRQRRRQAKDRQATAFEDFYEQTLAPCLKQWNVRVLGCWPFRFELPDGTRVDFWHTTGCYNVVGTTRYERGVNGPGLLKRLQKLLATIATKEVSPCPRS